ncbi:MAG: sigma-70 family RNA polymerase sigma factor [Actinomycetota bacterium]|nr:sigma-70 family RNA polymerase sigma factor [Actinomycetota bacterium]
MPRDRRREGTANVAASVDPGAARLVRFVRAAQGGDAESFSALVRDHGPGAFRFLAARLRNEADARDALQETLVAAWRSLPRLRNPERFPAWFLSIAVHKANDLARTRARGRDAPTPRERTTEDSPATDLRDAVESLPPNLRNVVLLRYVVDLSERETAHVLGVRPGTVKSRANRARTLLARALADDERKDGGSK